VRERERSSVQGDAPIGERDLRSVFPVTEEDQTHTGHRDTQLVRTPGQWFELE
jgi:hypothetical protein